MEIAKKTRFGSEEVHVANALHELGVLLQRAERFEEAERVLRQSLAMKDAMLGPEDTGLTMTLRELGICVRKQGCLEDAEEMNRRTKTQESKLDPEDLQIGLHAAPAGCLRTRV